MKRSPATVLALGLLICLATGTWAGTKPDLSRPDFKVAAGSSGIAGLTATGTARMRALRQSNGRPAVVRLWGVKADAPSLGMPGIYLRLPDDFERAASGNTISVSVLARRPPGIGNTSFAMTYSTNEVGNAGWRKFALTDQLQRYAFTFDVKTMVAGAGDYVGFLPDPSGKGGQVDIAEIAIDVVPPAAAVSPAATASPGTPVVPAAQATAVAAPAAQPAEAAPATPADGLETAVVSSAYYDIAVSKMKLPSFGLRGGIARLGDGLLYGAHLGRLFYIPDLSDLSGDRIIELQNRPPFDLTNPKLKRLKQDTLTILGIGAEKSRAGTPDGWDIYESNLQYDAVQDCISIVLWRAEVTLHGAAAPTFDRNWESIFRSTPCLPLSRMTHEASLQESGGRIDFDAKGIVMTLGLGSTLKNEEANDPATGYAQLDDYDYGKVIRIDRNSLAVTHIAKGVRNPQGLFVDRDGTIFESEHGPQGGDEVNVIVDGANYGWPFVTFGAQYGTKAWLYDSGPEAQARFKAPLFAFVPSIGPSELVRVHGEEFSRWKGDLILASLTGGSSGTPKGLSLFRLHDADGRILFSEPIFIGARLRDILEWDDGRLVVLTDDAKIFILSDAARHRQAVPASGAADAATIAASPEQVPAEATAGPAGTATVSDSAFRSKCASCHGLEPGNPNAIAPALGCVFGGRVASTDTYAYSMGLKGKSSSVWTADALAAFLSNPKA